MQERCRVQTICRTGVGSNSIFCNSCKRWVHKQCSGLKCLTEDPDYKCTQFQGTTCPFDGRVTQSSSEGSPIQTWQTESGSFLLLPKRLLAASGCELSTSTCVNTAWKKFKELLPVLSFCHLSFKTHGCVYSSCVWSTMLHASETWPLTKPNLQSLQWIDRAMIRQICNVKSQDIIRFNELLAQLGIEDLDLILKERRLHWYGRLECSHQPVTYRLMENLGLGGQRWHRSSWQRGIAESGSSRVSTLMIETHGDLVWDLRCMQQASYLEGDPLMWLLPLYLQANKRSGDDDDKYSPKWERRQIFSCQSYSSLCIHSI